MKKILSFLTLCIALAFTKAFSQTVYINQTGTTFHTKACALYTKNFEGVPLWKARDVYGKKPCKKCNPPTKEVKTAPKKKPVKKKAPVKKAPAKA